MSAPVENTIVTPEPTPAPASALDAIKSMVSDVYASGAAPPPPYDDKKGNGTIVEEVF